MAKKRRYKFADGHYEELETPSDELIEFWYLTSLGWSEFEVATMTPTQTHIDRFYSDNDRNTDLQRGLTKAMDARANAGLGRYSNNNHIVAKKSGDMFDRVKEKIPEPIREPPVPPKPITFTAEKFTTSRGPNRLKEGLLAKYKYTYEIKQKDVSFGRVEAKFVKAPVIVHKEYVETVNVRKVSGLLRVKPENLTRASKKVYRKFYDLQFKKYMPFLV